MFGSELLCGLIIQEQDLVEINVGGSVEEKQTRLHTYHETREMLLA